MRAAPSRNSGFSLRTGVGKDVLRCDHAHFVVAEVSTDTRLLPRNRTRHRDFVIVEQRIEEVPAFVCLFGIDEYTPSGRR